MATRSISVIQEANLDAAKRKYLKVKEAYYNDQPIMSDTEFDKLEDSIRRLHPNWKELKKTGVKVANKKTEVPLEEFMPSLNKMYPEAVDKFYNRSSNQKVKRWIWMDKLDGTSLQLVYYKGKPVQLITRGDGTLGGDISFFIPHLVELGRIPERIPEKRKVVLRIEGLMQKKVFEKKWASKFDNIRNTVNGLFNRQDMHSALKHVDLVVLGVFGLTLSSGLKNAIEWGFNVVYFEITGRRDGHSECLLKRREVSDYEMDGIVVAPSDWTMEYKDAEKPKELIAFKLNDEENAAQVKVKKVIWQKTRTGRWQPKIEIEPTPMDGVVVTNATAHNPQWMKDRGIGPGAIVKVLRSGGVIPKIVDTVKPAEFEGPPGDYEQRGKFFYVVEHDKSVEVRKIHHFMTTLGIELLAEKTISKLYDAGFTSAASYMELMQEREILAKTRLEKKGGLGVVMSQKIYEELRRGLAAQLSLKLLMVASGFFNGVGERRLSMLEKAGLSMNDLYMGKGTDLFLKIKSIKGFSDKTAQQIVDGKLAFGTWFREIKQHLTVDGSLPKVKVRNEVGKLKTVRVSWTGYRSPEEEATVEAQGGEVIKFGAQTDVLLYRLGGKASGKVEKAGSKALTWEQFSKKYGV